VSERFEFVLYDLASTNGSYVNGALVHMAVLRDNDRIRIGETELVFKKVEDPPMSSQ
jgi:pSer/pThr/pTyr-binding forkhead associated (FHA) protein